MTRVDCFGYPSIHSDTRFGYLAELFDEAAKTAFESLIPHGETGRSEEIATVI